MSKCRGDPMLKFDARKAFIVIILSAILIPLIFFWPSFPILLISAIIIACSAIAAVYYKNLSIAVVWALLVIAIEEMLFIGPYLVNGISFQFTSAYITAAALGATIVFFKKPLEIVYSMAVSGIIGFLAGATPTLIIIATKVLMPGGVEGVSSAVMMLLFLFVFPCTLCGVLGGLAVYSLRPFWKKRDKTSK
jgi:hypothetical protein